MSRPSFQVPDLAGFRDLDLPQAPVLLDPPSCRCQVSWNRAQGGAAVITEKDDVLLTSSEVAAILDISPDTVNEFARKSILPGFKRGRQWRFWQRDVASYKRQLRGTTAA